MEVVHHVIGLPKDLIYKECVLLLWRAMSAFTEAISSVWAFCLCSSRRAKMPIVSVRRGLMCVGLTGFERYSIKMNGGDLKVN